MCKCYGHKDMKHDMKLIYFCHVIDMALCLPLRCEVKMIAYGLVIHTCLCQLYFYTRILCREYSFLMQGGGGRHWNKRGQGRFNLSKGGIGVGMVGGLHFLCTQ